MITTFPKSTNPKLSTERDVEKGKKYFPQHQRTFPTLPTLKLYTKLRQSANRAVRLLGTLLKMESLAEDPTDFEEEDQTPIVTEGEDYSTDLLSGTGSSPTANIIASAGMNLLPDKNLSFLSDELNKRQRCNAKAVEWLSMEGEHLGQFRSVSSLPRAPTTNLNISRLDKCISNLVCI